jgi:A/G-specific adenine glycosylase
MPWRNTTNPYHITVSEIMLQQTQIDRVRYYYPIFLKKFPTWEVLANASPRDVLEVWQGMGYNRRALYLKRIAESVVHIHNGKLPHDIRVLQTLPGIGPYTARSIRCFSFGLCEPFIETNIRRSIIHEFFPRSKKISDENIFKILTKCEPARNKKRWYLALMDYGREGLKGIPNANTRSATYTHQTTFTGSTRHMRSLILKTLLLETKCSRNMLFAQIKKEASLSRTPPQLLTQILNQLQKEKLITKKGSAYTLPSQ